MISFWVHDREWFAHLYRPMDAPRAIGGMVSSGTHHLALSVGIRGWRGVVVGWSKPNPHAQMGRHRRCRKVGF